MKRLKLRWKPRNKRSLTNLQQRFQKVKSLHQRKKRRNHTYLNSRQPSGTRTLMMSIHQLTSQTRLKRTSIMIATSISRQRLEMKSDYYMNII